MSSKIAELTLEFRKDDLKSNLTKEGEFYIFAFQNFWTKEIKKFRIKIVSCKETCSCTIMRVYIEEDKAPFITSTKVPWVARQIKLQLK